MHDFEKALLGAILKDNKALMDIGGLKAEDFQDPQARLIFGEMLKLFQSGTRIDALNLTKELEGKVQGDPVTILMDLMDMPTGSVKHYVDKITDTAVRKRVKEAGQKITVLPDKNAPLDEIVSEMGLIVAQAAETATGERADFDSCLAEFERLQEIYHEKYQHGGGIIGISTGYQWLDGAIDGIRPGHFWVIGGYSSSGKTFFSLNIVANLATQGKRVLFFSLEMSKADIIARLLGIMTEVNSTIIMRQPLHADTVQTYNQAKNTLRSSGLAIYGGIHDYSRVLLAILQEHYRSPVDCVVIDYIQLFKTFGKSEYESMTVIATELQNFAKKTGIPIILLSQVSNEHAKNDSPTMGFKGSGAIGASADLGLELRIPKHVTKEVLAEKRKNNLPYNVEITAKKNRHGKMGSFICDFWGWHGRFVETNIDPEAEKPVEVNLDDPSQLWNRH